MLKADYMSWNLLILYSRMCGKKEACINRCVGVGSLWVERESERGRGRERERGRGRERERW